MPLDFPPGFPEAYRLPVIAAEAPARAKLLKHLKVVDWSFVPKRGRYISQDEVLPHVVEYLCTVAGTFAEQACLAVKAMHYPATALDTAVETFVEETLYHIYSASTDRKIRQAWSDSSEFVAATTLPVMQGSWHAAYLAEVPRVIEALMPRLVSETTEADIEREQRSKSRRQFVEPLLAARAITVTEWATKAGVDPSVALDYLNGLSSPRPKNREALAGVLNLRSPDLPQ